MIVTIVMVPLLVGVLRIKEVPSLLSLFFIL